MPFLVRIILQRALALMLGFLAFLGINPTIPTNEQINQIEKEQEKIVENILSDYNNQNLDLNKDLIKEIITPKENLENEKKQNYTKINQTTKEQVSPTFEEKPLDIIIETIVDNIETKDQKEIEIASVLVNIICTERKGNYITVNTGSGVIVSPKGVVMTNAHVGQYFLLDKDLDDYSCALYQENIPTYGYLADLLYISPDWIKENPDVITSKNPRGTGENDYALLYITKNTNPALSKQKRFPYVNINTNYEPEIGDQIEIGGFPGAPESITDLNHTVGLKTDLSSIKDIFTFNQTTIDVISTGATKVAARGASGGGIFKDSSLIGLIVTTGGNGSNSYINAITTNYINRDLKKDYNISISELLDKNLESESENFWNLYGKDLAKIILAKW